MPEDVKFDLSNLKKLSKDLLQESVSVGSSPIRDVFRQWAAMYRSFAQRRFVRASRGDGTWVPLKAGTIARRRKGKGRGMSAAILTDKGLLRQALDIQFSRRPGQHQEDIPGGVIVGYGGPAKYPNSSVTIADIAKFHQTGAGNLPVREIIVEPDKATIAMMTRRLVQVVKGYENG